MIQLPYPRKALWPNGRSHWRAKAKQVKKHREWARLATLADATRPTVVGRLIVTLYPKPTGPAPDRDNIVAACKAYVDGIADAYRTDDRDWPVPTVIIAERCAHGAVVVAIEPPQE